MSHNCIRKNNIINNKIPVSVIVPVYNVDKYLSNCLESLVNQTFRDIEIICINDCSTDKSLAILKQYASKDKRIRIINLEKNGGVSNARNIGIAQSKGVYLSFIDSDDTVDLDFFEKLYFKADAEHADIVKAEILEHCLDGKVQRDIFKINRNIKENKGFLNFFTFWVSAIYKKSLINDNNILFDTNLSNGEDGLFLMKAVINARKIEVIDNTYYNYQRRAGSANSDKLPGEAIKSLLISYSEILNLADLNSKDKGYLNLYYFYINNTIKNVFRTNDINLKKMCICKALEFYNQCLLKDKISVKIKNEYQYLFNAFFNNNVEELESKLINENYHQFVADNLRAKILNKNAIYKNIFIYPLIYIYIYIYIYISMDMQFYFNCIK